jgi:hypothetical protein
MTKEEEILKTSPAEVEKLIEQIRGINLKPSAKEQMERLLRTILTPVELLHRKNTTIKKPREMIFCISGATTRGLPTTRCAAHIINLLIWVGLSVSPSLWPSSSPVQASAGERRAAQSAQETDSLEPGKPIERELSGGQSHSYKITMISGQYLQVVVDQRGIDVAVALFTPDGKKISETDSKPVVE